MVDNVNKAETIGRIYITHPKQGELYYMRMLLF